MDPTRVPIPASVRERSEPSFQDRLDTASETRERVPRPNLRQEPRDEQPVDAPETSREQPPVETAEAEPIEPSELSRSQPLPYRSDREADPVLSETAPIERPTKAREDGEAVVGIPITLSKSPVRAPEPGTGEYRTTPAVPPASTNQARSAAPLEAKPPAEGVRPLRTHVTAERTQAGYRTINKSTVQLAETARDSVFRQIAMRINGEGGEMRVLMDPPELGQLDLHMVVEKGGTVHLSLIAERPELALALDKHMAELKQSLQVQGLSIGNTEVRAREEHARDRGRREDGLPRASASRECDDLAAAASRRAGYITAEGLDFWV